MKIGDVVYLNSNPEMLMTVLYVLDDNDKQNAMLNLTLKRVGCDILCEWFDDKSKKRDVFKSAMLSLKN